MNPSQNKWLIVEGHDDRQSVIGLMKSHTNWPDGKDACPVWIELGKSVDEILDESAMRLWLKHPRIQTLGIMLDADANPPSRYDRFRKLCVEFFPEIPGELASDGLMANREGGKRLGLWIMPDNKTAGTLETFLRNLVPSSSEPLWQRAVEAVSDAKKIGATFKDCHVEKANLFTWLAWQDPPDQSPGRALTKRYLDPKSPYADPFAAWFCKLYALPTKIS